MKFYIVRHGETQWNKEEVFRGRKDIPLNETGKYQAERTGTYFADKPITRILSSPLSRAMQTAGAIGRTTGTPVEPVEALTDINFGIWEGIPLREVNERYPSDFALWMTSPERLRIEGTETLDEVRKRISDGLANLRNGEDANVIVTHRVICKVIVLYLLSLGNEHFWDMKFDPASVTLVEQNRDRWVLSHSNDTCHLHAQIPPSGYRDF